MNNLLHDPPISSETQLTITRTFWAPSIGDQFYCPRNLDPYFCYYIEQTATYHNVFGEKILLRSHQDVIDIANDMLQGLPRSSIEQSLLKRHPDLTAPGSSNGDLLRCSIDLVVRLLTMLDVGVLPRTYTGRYTLEWTNPTWTVSDFLEETFKPQRVMSHDGIRLGPHFTARNLDLIVGLNVELTTNIADHLLLREEEKTVLIFHHASFLKNQMKSVPFSSNHKHNLLINV